MYKNHDCKAPACATCFKYDFPSYEEVMFDTIQTVDADNRDEFNGWFSLEQIVTAAFQLGEITLSQYQNNRIALEKLVF